MTSATLTPSTMSPATTAATIAPSTSWTAVCAADDILPNTGVCALIEGRHVAVFKVGTSEYHAIDNVDPKSGASVLARGLVGSLSGRTVVASPLYKNHFDLQTGECLELPEMSVQAHRVALRDGWVWVSLA